MSKEGLILIFLTILIGYDEITENISELSESSGFPITLLLKLALLILIVYLSLKFLLKLFKKSKHNNPPQTILHINDNTTVFVYAYLMTQSTNP